MAKLKCTFGFGIVVLFLAMAIPGWAADMGTAITYQGRLLDNGDPANDDYDFQFTVYDAPLGGAPVGVPVTPGDVTVKDGVFTEVLDFGAGVFDGAPRWLEIGVRPGDSVGPYKILEPRQELTPNPYSLYAKAAGAVVGGIGIGGNGTANYIAKFTGSDTIGDSLIYESNTGNIGIGTNNPVRKLDVRDTSGIAIFGSNEDDTYATIYAENIGEGPAARFQKGDVIVVDDNVGIGNTDPIYRLEVGDISEANNYMRIRSQDWAGLLFYDGEQSHSGMIQYYHGDDSMRFDNRTGASATEKMRITTDGYVGIGTTAPTRVLDVDGQITLRPGTLPNAGIWLTDTSDVDEWFVGKSNLAGKNQMAFWKDSWLMAIQDDGKVGIGTTAPTHLLTVDGDVKGTGSNGPTNGYLGIQGTDDFDGVATADWAGDEIGVAGISTGSTAGDNFGVLGHSNGVGVRGEYSGNPAVDYGELGANGVGVYGTGSTWAGQFDGEIRLEGDLELYNSSGTKTVHLDNDNSGESYMYLYDGSGSTYTSRIMLWANEGNGGKITLTDNTGITTITLDGDVSGDGRITTQELSITGGSDLSEQFDVAASGAIKPQPGMVVSIDPARAGKLVVSSSAYDKKVAGIISGAGGVKTGMMMADEGTLADGEYPIALTGRVFCYCEAGSGAIEPGDMLTTSNVAGYAMKVTDHNQAHGTVIGKAMTGLNEGRGLVLVLVQPH